MILLIDGPLIDKRLAISRCPVFLRIAQGENRHVRAIVRKVDREPSSRETVFVYHLKDKPMMADGHLHSIAHGVYYHLDVRVPPAALRDRDSWGEWSAANYEKYAPDWFLEMMKAKKLG